MANRHADKASASSSASANNRGSTEEPHDALKLEPLRPARAHLRGANDGPGHYPAGGHEQEVGNDSIGNDDDNDNNTNSFVAVGMESDADAQVRVRLPNRNRRMTKPQFIGTNVAVFLVIAALIGVGAYKSNTRAGTTAGIGNKDLGQSNQTGPCQFYSVHIGDMGPLDTGD